MNRSRARFQTTRWSLICSTSSDDQVAARAALDELCQTYWMPLYAVLRRDGHDETSAMDLVQGFITRLLEQRDIHGADPDRGRFRSYLLGALRHYVQNERRHDHAQMRGGGAELVSLDAATAEGRYQEAAIAVQASPEQLYERQFALALLQSVVEKLAAEYRDRGRGEAFEQLKQFLVEAPAAGDYQRLASELGAEEGAIKVTVHRMRKRLRALMTAEIADTLSDPSHIEDEYASLLAALGGK